MRKLLALVGVALLCVGAAHARETYGLLLIESAGADGYVSVEVDLGALQKALLPDEVPAPLSPPRVFLEKGDDLVPLALQSDDAAPGRKRLTFVLTPDTPCPARARLYFLGRAPEGEPPAHQAPLAVRQDGERVIVNNGYAEVVHDPAVQAGLPTRVTLVGTGKTLEGFSLNDRIYDRELGCFYVRQDKDARVRLLRSGPLEATVEVCARFVQGDKTPESAPTATLHFNYRAGTPAVEVTGHYEQSQAFFWHELHLMEWNFPGRPLPRWAAGPATESGLFEKDRQSRTPGKWASLSDGTNVVGIACSGPKLYSGNGYGSYVHGPWVSWSGTEKDLRCILWLDGSPGTIKRLASYSASPASVHVTTPTIERQYAGVRRQVDSLAAGRLRGLHGWWLTMTERLHRHTMDLAGVHRQLDTQMQWLKETPASQTGVEARIADLFEARHGRSVLHTQELLLGLGGAEEGYSPLSLFSLVRERELLSGAPQPLWTLSLENTEGRSWEWSGVSDTFSCSSQVNGDKTTIIWQGQADAAGITATLDLTLSGSAVTLKLDVDNASEDISIMQVRFPELSLGQIGDDADDDVFLRPEASGTLAKAPLLNGLHSTTTYPSGWGSFQFVTHYDGDCGIYIGVHDPVASLKRFKSDRADDAVAVTVEWPAPDASRPGNDFEHPGEVVLAALTGDWFDAAQIYRAWAAKEAAWWAQRGEWGRPDTADWVKDICVWALAHGGPEQVVGPTKKFAEFMGVPTAVHWYSWHVIPFDDDYPHYFPVKEGFAEGVAELQAAGVRVMPYINGRLWDSDTDDFQAVALPGASKDRKGEHYVEIYGSGEKLVPMCPTQQVWQDKVQEIVLRLMSPECNVDGVYIDQVAAAAPRECYDATHGHPLCGGHWWTTDGYWPMLDALNRKIDGRCPGKFLTTECNAEPYTHVFDGYLTWHFQYDGAVPVFAAIYGGKIQTFSRAYRGNDQLAHRMKTAQALVFGEQLGWINPGIVDDHPDTAAYLRRCARVRRALLPYLSRGYMARPPKVSGDIPDVTADWAWRDNWMVTDSALQRGAWRAEDGSVAFVFANTTEEPVSFTWHFDAAQYDLPASALTSRRVTETSESDWTPAEGTFDKTMALDPVAVEAVVLR